MRVTVFLFGGGGGGGGGGVGVGGGGGGNWKGLSFDVDNLEVLIYATCCVRSKSNVDVLHYLA